MTLEQYAYLAEILGVAIVVITFIFLTIQLRLGTRALKAGTVQNLQNQTMAVYGMLLDDMDLFMKGMEDPTSLNKLDRAKFNALMTVNFHALQNAYFQIQSGAYDDCMQVRKTPPKRGRNPRPRSASKAPTGLAGARAVSELCSETERQRIEVVVDIGFHGERVPGRKKVSAH